MDPTLLIAGIGAITSIIGASEERKAARRQERLQARALATQNSAAAVQQASANEQYQSSKKLVEVSKQQEEIRKMQFRIEAQKITRETIRNAQEARAQAIAGAVEGGGSLQSSGVQGVIGGISNDRASQLGTIESNRQFGLRNFGLNQAIFNIQSQSADRQARFSSKLAGYQTQLRTLGVQSSNAQAQGDFGKSLFNTGVNIMQNSGTAGNVVQSLFTGTK